MAQQGGNKLFGQTMKKKQSGSSRYQRQFGGGGRHRDAAAASEQDAKAAEAAARRRQRQEQGEAIDRNFGYNRLEDQTIADPDQVLVRRGWLYHMLATTVRTCNVVTMNSMNDCLNQSISE